MLVFAPIPASSCPAGEWRNQGMIVPRNGKQILNATTSRDQNDSFLTERPITFPHRSIFLL
jgi:hypothetical protein